MRKLPEGFYWRGDKIWCRYVGPDGEAGRGSTRTADVRVARQRKRDWFELGQHPDRAPDGADGTLGGAMTHLLDVVYAGRNADTVESYRQKARHVLRVLGAATKLRDIDRVRCQEYRATRLKEGAKAHTIHKEAVVLRLALSEQGVEGVVPRFKAEYTPVERYLTHDAFGKLLAALPAHRQLWIVVACFLGARDSELVRLRWEDVDFKAGTIIVRGTKTKKARLRVVPLAPFLLLALALAAPRVRKGVLLGKWTNRRRAMTGAWWKVVGWTPPPQWTQGGIDRHGKKRSIKGAPRLSPNDLRRTFVSWVKQRGADSSAVADVIGSSAKMVDLVYGQLNDESRARVVALLPEPPERK